MSNLKFSIITPTLNSKKVVEKTIESVLNQDYPNIEYIIVDGASTDSTLEILKRYGDRIKWISERDRSPTEAINKGFRMATGDIVVTLAAGDYYEPGILKKIAEIFASDEKIDLVYGGYFLLRKTGVKERIEIPEVTADILIKIGMVMSEPATFVRSKFIKEVGLLDESLTIASLYEWFIKIFLAAKKIVQIPEAVFTYMEHSDAHSRKDLSETARQCWIAARRHGAKFYHPVALRYFYRKYPVLFKPLEFAWKNMHIKERAISFWSAKKSL
jgi:glycosyltransferase involved in cell wall biosynthesis